MNQHYNDMIYSNTYLEHHGVQGQKWGVTNGPPYPLGQDVCKILQDPSVNNKALLKAMKKNYKQANGAYTKEAYNKDRQIVKIDAEAKKQGDEFNRQFILAVNSWAKDHGHLPESGYYDPEKRKFYSDDEV